YKRVSRTRWSVYNNALVTDLLGVTVSEYTTSQMTYDLRRLRLKGLIFRPPRTNRFFITPYGWKVARLFSRREARVFSPVMSMFTANDTVHPFFIVRPWRLSAHNRETEVRSNIMLRTRSRSVRTLHRSSRHISAYNWRANSFSRYRISLKWLQPRCCART